MAKKCDGVIIQKVLLDFFSFRNSPYYQGEIKLKRSFLTRSLYQNIARIQHEKGNSEATGSLKQSLNDLFLRVHRAL
jgi:hypothetical protein